MLDGERPAERSTADAPATCGAAIEVPLITLWPPNCVTGHVERMSPPGAPRSGFRPSSAVGPHELKLETRPPVACGRYAPFAVHVSVCGPPAIAAAIAWPSAREVATTGIVTAGWPAGGATVGFTNPAALL